MQILRKFSSTIDGLNDLIGMFIRWLTLAMVMIGAINAVARYFARSQQWTLNLTPATEAQWYLFSLIFLLGAAYGLNHNVHVRVDVMYERMKPKTQAWIDLCGTILFLIPFSVMMLYVSYPAVRTSISIREMSPDPGGLPRFPIKALIIFSFVMLLLQAMSQIVKQIDVIRGTSPALSHHEGELEAHS